ncbi:hypothetical protein H696_00248 [Fonticula alba]|uniref:Activator of Hsp90 ATPase AHSA1-like N-terminal domain-containing protein n=1 Tax=Fonticula alba TaxID=691883 RepID=A0A058ZFG1_FONAL|nr:hypothetical protein H696_00248 [Fonticula alba]KCV72668.1 hypothetical protein H696_00248 [Fonticula alba]|eukprot:XP_009492369.1 hypothetical protein H696_00248 [Fonticula alba]
MAKWGQGDPRWIVEERPDSTNVNNWHWSETNVYPWASEHLGKHFTQLEVPSSDPEWTFLIKSLEKVEGDVSLINRKGRIRTIFDLTLNFQWKATLASDPETTVSGNLKLMDFNQEETASDADFNITVTGSSPHATKLRQLVRRDVLGAVVGFLIGAFMEDLKVQFTGSVLLPTHSTSSGDLPAAPKAAAPTPVPAAATAASTAPAPAAAKKPAAKDTVSVTVTADLLAPPEEIFDVFTRAERARPWAQNGVVLSPVEGAPFTLLNGSVAGEMVSLDRPGTIIQKWRLSSWPASQAADAKITLVPGERPGSPTKVTVKLVGVCREDQERVRACWNQGVFESIRRAFGWGSAQI